jgi:uncharacterized protein YcaQ
VDRHFAHGRVTNFWGGASNATTQLLDAMHYRGLLRIARRENGVRIYAVRSHGRAPARAAERRARIDALADVAIRVYAPLHAAGLAFLVRRLAFAAPQWHGELDGALSRARERSSRARIDGVDWYWPAGEGLSGDPPPEVVRLLAPFDPLVRNRDRFELLWGWVYRFEAYTPLSKRKLGYYALPLLWRDRVVGWGNLAVRAGRLDASLGYLGDRPPRDRAFRRALDEELDRIRDFLGLGS